MNKLNDLIWTHFSLTCIRAVEVYALTILLNTNKSMVYLNWKYAGQNVLRSVHIEFMHSMFEVSTNKPPLLLACSKSLLHIIAHCWHIKSKYLHRNERIFVENMINCCDFVFAPSNHNYTIISLRGKHTKKYGHGFGLLTVGSLNCHLHKKFTQHVI